MPTTGEKPGKGTYYCTNCGQAVTLDEIRAIVRETLRQVSE